MFVGHDFVVTVRHGQGGALHRRGVGPRGHDASVLAHGPSAVVYAVCDQVVDDYEEVAAALQEDVDEVETSVFSTERTNDSGPDLHPQARARRDAPRRAAARASRCAGSPTGSVARRSHEDAAPYFRDVADHLARVAETIDSLDSLLSTAFDAHLAQISVQQNDDMRKISAGVGAGRRARP